MTIAEILATDFDPEINSTRRLLERIPEHDPGWKPHPKSMPIGRLALHTAQLPDFLTRILTTDEMNLQTTKFPDFKFESTGHLLQQLDARAAEAKRALMSSSDEQLLATWKLLLGDRVILDSSRLLLFRTMFLNHMVHHRAQLGVYLRLLDIPVPGLYGPSADEPFG